MDMDGTQMKNYVVWTNCSVTEVLGDHGIEPAGAPGVRESYDAMFQASLASVQQNLRGAWTGIVIDQEQPTRLAMFKNNYTQIRDLWHSEPCNILFVDSDTVMVKPVEIFGRWPEFRLFNWTTPPRHSLFDNYFNCAVRYYPAHMSPKVWAIGDREFRAWDNSIYDHEQLMFNHMFWSQGLTWEDAHHPELNWQAENGMTLPQLAEHAQFNNLPLGQARIIHYHGTRSHNRGAFLASMLPRAAGIPVPNDS
jgi:hypothetical protein